MSSPNIDLDMNLDSPPWNGGSTNAFTAQTGLVSDSHGVELASLNTTVKNSSSPIDAADTNVGGSQSSSQEPSEENETPKANLEEIMELVESWREEINMMSVKNAILLDDLVKVGADI
jgi:hypothetical protein